MRMIITSMRRIKNDANGNPRYRITTSGGHIYNTAKGAAFVHGPLSLPLVPGEYGVTVNRRGTIDNIEIIPNTKECRRCGKILPATTDEADRRVNILWDHRAVGPCVMTETEMSQ